MSCRSDVCRKERYVSGASVFIGHIGSKSMLISYCCIMRFTPDDWPVMSHSMFYVMVALTTGWVGSKWCDIKVTFSSVSWKK